MTTTNNRFMSTETLPHTNPELQLSLEDLVHPTETAEDLLISLSTEQLTIIEHTLSKIKRRKLNPPDLTVNVKAEEKPPNETIETPTLNPPAPKPTPSPPPVNNGTLETTAKPPTPLTQEPTTEVKEGVEWVSFVYSHHRTLRKYCIRTDLDNVDINILDEKFKKENCVYPRANLPQETYQGNRWTYETECNLLGWKLAYLNMEEIAGKRGLIQRAVDSYRNRYPSMRSRRVARQEKLLKGTLRKRKQREDEKKPTPETDQHVKLPKTILIEDLATSTKCRIRINIESVILDAVDLTFRKNNCVFPRSMNITPDTPSVSQRRIDEAKCNEIGWKLAWLNPRQLSNKKNLLQRALDIFRTQFAPDLKPRKYASRTPPPPPLPLTDETLAAQQGSSHVRKPSASSCYSGTTVTLDFHDYCFSPPPEEIEDIEVPIDVPLLNEFIAAPITDCRSSTTSASSSSDDSPSPQSLLTLTEIYQQAALFMTQQQEEGEFKQSNDLQNMLDLVNAGIGNTSDPTTLALNQLLYK